ncbi:MAG: UDP-N-acetylmuramoyl-L-alanine--D-glutamate ligase, partial [Muribaculaceae bacterium]|nr:UDP-N-acetylmuramoyl-L-alanine--D-glutamate ligase [Muribaculaceae bacterium]
QGGHTEALILNADEVVKSPGIPPTAPIMLKIKEKGIPVISEIELAGRYSDAKMVCITGSNGKTTTTLLIHHILTSAGIDAGLAGNVGHSMALQVARSPHPVYVIELSSFQLEDMRDFRANVAVMLNITPDHLDRYEHKMENYVRAKFRILNNMRPVDAFVYWHDDPVIAAQMRQMAIEASLYPFAEHKEEENTAAYVDGENRLVINTPGRHFTMPRADLALNGMHNLYNSMAAGISASLLDIRDADIRKALGDFQGVEHRLEYAGTVDDVRYINDSKATNVNSTWYALESMSTPVVLILGGKDKGNDYSEILPLVRQKVKAIVAMGVDNTKIVNYFDGVVPVIDTHSLADAVEACRSQAKAGDTVLLSPCCASFDLFSSYEDRGRQFKDQVKKMEARQ